MNSDITTGLTLTGIWSEKEYDWNECILERIISGGDRSPIFAGAVKSTQMRLFVHALNWYIKRGSKARFGAPIAADWDTARASAISDNAAMTALFTTLPRANDGVYYVSCALLRQFPSLTEFYAHDLGGKSWLDFFEDHRKRLFKTINIMAALYLTMPPLIFQMTIIYLCAKTPIMFPCILATPLEIRPR